MPTRFSLKHFKSWLKINNKTNSTIVVRQDFADTKSSNIEELTKKINLIDEEILETTKNLFEAQSIKLRSALDSQNGFLLNLQKKWYLSAANNSANWHRNYLIELTQRRKILKINLDKINGKYWSNQIKYIMQILVLIFCTILICSILVMGIITAIYLLPIWLLICLGVWLYKKKRDFG